MVVKTVDVNSLCSHHFIPFVSTDEKDSRAVIAYVPRLGSDKALLGISKLQRIMDYFGRRPQLPRDSKLANQNFHFFNFKKSKCDGFFS